jgi:hypothetical protein
MRDSPFSAAARENLGKWRSTWEVPPHRFSGMGSVMLHTEKPILSVPKNCWNTAVAAPPCTA